MTITAGQSFNFSNISATTAAFTVEGGIYSLDVTATFGGGNVQLQMLAVDGSTWINIGTQVTTASQQSPIYLPPGQCRLAITTATAVFASLARVPL